ncbi:putative hydroxypyruvate isomerase [Salmonella enterica subsp. enterica]|nr:putative hydroxypyruvate isomerase [Salmonella enterica subsp. enterica]
MPRFAANLSMMFTEVPFIERFAAAAEAGFQAVEFLFPYGFAASEIKAQLSRHDLTLALFNTSAGDTAAGEWGTCRATGARTRRARRYRSGSGIRSGAGMRAGSHHGGRSAGWR